MKRLLMALVLTQLTITPSSSKQLTEKDVHEAADKKCREVLKGEEKNQYYNLALSGCKAGFIEGISWTEDYLIAALIGKNK